MAQEKARSPEYYFWQRRSDEQKRRQRDWELYTWYVGEFQYNFCDKVSSDGNLVTTAQRSQKQATVVCDRNW